MKDTADEIGTIGECLYSIGNRVKIAQELLVMHSKDETQGFDCLLDTILEDIYRSTQDLFDAYCVVKEE